MDEMVAHMAKRATTSKKPAKPQSRPVKSLKAKKARKAIEDDLSRGQKTLIPLTKPEKVKLATRASQEAFIDHMRSKHPEGPKKNVGTFFNTSGRMIVSDPIYSVKLLKKPEKHGMWIGPAAKGEWEAYVQIGGMNVVGMLCARKTNSHAWRWEVLNYDLFVDSALMAISDHTPEFGSTGWNDRIHWLVKKSIASKKSYQGYATIDWKGNNIGVVSSSGYGDGQYLCSIKKNKKGEAIEFKVIFAEGTYS